MFLNISTAIAINLTALGRRYDGIGGLSGGGATSTFLQAYPHAARSEILDWLFVPNRGISLNIMKMEIGADDQTTDGCESSHMRTPLEVNCSRGYEFLLAKAAVVRNPDLLLYGLPWGFAGWLGFNTTNPYHNVTATADYIARWVECGRDTHGLNISMLGLWNEADAAAGRPLSDVWDYTLALRERLDKGGLHHVRIIGSDGGDTSPTVDVVLKNKTVRDATWGIGAHYPGARGTTAQARGLYASDGIPLWSSEDYSTYSDAIGAACWGRLLVQNAGWGYSATISWYMISAYARGMHYVGDGFIRAEWPTSGHWELTPMTWITMHWTLFTKPGWRILPCADLHGAPGAGTPKTGACALKGGGNYAVLRSGGGGEDFSIMIHAYRHVASQCIRQDPTGDWPIAATQTATFSVNVKKDAGRMLHVWRSCAGWRYPSLNDGYLEKQNASVVVSAKGTFNITVDADCYYTVTTITNRTKPAPPASLRASLSTPSSALSSSTAPSSSQTSAFPLPYFEDFEGPTAGGEASNFGDQMGKWETVPAGGGRTGHASRQQLGLDAPWPIIEPQCNDHSTPLSIIGDLFWESVRVTADVLVEEEKGVGAGLALRVRMANTRDTAPGLFLWIGALPGSPTQSGTHHNPGGLAPSTTTPLKKGGWALCADSMCSLGVIKQGITVAAAAVASSTWHTLSLATHPGGYASGTLNGVALFHNLSVGPPPPPSPTSSQATCARNTILLPASKIVLGTNYDVVTLGTPLNSSAVAKCLALCCTASKCMSWAVQAGKCWLKSDAVVADAAKGEVEFAKAVKPGNTPTPAPVATLVPPSGWAAIVATLGGSQVDNFKLEGLADGGGGGGGVAKCAATTPAAGIAVSSTPCDQEGAWTHWVVRAGKDGGGLKLDPHPATPSVLLCLGASGALIPCASASPKSLVYHNATDGQLHVGASDSASCMIAVQKEATDEHAATVRVAPCTGAQRFQLNPNTGALRSKGSECVASFTGAIVQYRDCCIAVC